MDVPIHHLLRQLRDTGWSWREIAVAYPELGLDPADDYDAVAAAARLDVVRPEAVPARRRPRRVPHRHVSRCAGSSR